MHLIEGVELIVMLKNKIEEAKKTDQASVQKLQKLLEKLLKSHDAAYV
ncbi:hypothetical protein [Sulfurospirillum multivorans]|uniref:Uncharacterized protein n=2 Tax=Sulfurospirillum multivorans TaxID=66821 RepID=A0AA86AMP3_SULMK|nr:hypothetical protein [Sulfurospirillum multivorans]AHJ13685.1 hypothetical protein SMUL_2440 [Sulfurospirillum multivorans DSM 12446]QEH07175.1 hypothetical protein SMN_2418 [Sulfurospirillum multivorans]